MRSNTVFFLSTASCAMSVLFIPLIAQQMGASMMSTGAIVAVYGLMSLVSYYLFGWVSDTRGRLALIKAGMLFSALSFLLHLTAYDELSLFLVRAVAGFSIGIYYSSLLVYGLESGKKLGKYTAYESLGWGFGNLVAGIVAVYSKVFILASIFFFVSFLMALRLPRTKSKIVKVPLFPGKIIKKNIGIYLPFLLRDIGAYSVWAFLPIYMISLGASTVWIGILYFINTGTQFVLKQYIDRFDHRKSFVAGLFFSAAAFYSYGVASDYLQLIPSQLLTALSWTTLSIGAMGVLAHTNQEKASVVGLFSSTRSFAQIIAPLAAGIITQYWGFKALMLFAGTLPLAGLAIKTLMRKN